MTAKEIKFKNLYYQNKTMNLNYLRIKYFTHFITGHSLNVYLTCGITILINQREYHVKKKFKCFNEKINNNHK